MAKQRWEIRASIAMRFGRYRKIIATSGSSTTIVSTMDFFEPNDYWNEHWAYCLRDAEGLSVWPEGFMRRISDYVQSTQTATVDLAFPGNTLDYPAEGDWFEIYPSNVPVPVLNSLMDDALSVASSHFYKETWDLTTLDFASNTHSYTLPTDVGTLRSVWTRASSNYEWKPFLGWSVRGQPGAFYLVTGGQMVTGDIALHYEAPLGWSTTPGTDASYLNIVSTPASRTHGSDYWAAEFINWYVTEQLHLKLMGEGDDTQANKHWNLARYAKKRHEEIARDHYQSPLVSQVTRPPWQEHSDDLRRRAYTELKRGGTEPGT